jgi:hypothetical protein
MQVIRFPFGNSGRTFAIATRSAMIAFATAILVHAACADTATNVTTCAVKGVFEESHSAGHTPLIRQRRVVGEVNWPWALSIGHSRRSINADANGGACADAPIRAQASVLHC